MRKRALKDNRIDDANESVIQHRISTYEMETKPILDYYPAEKVTTIDATQTPVRVLFEILQQVMTLPFYGKISTKTV
jgi:adenylate kinase